MGQTLVQFWLCFIQRFAFSNQIQAIWVLIANPVFSANLIDAEAIVMLALHNDFELSNQNISFFTNHINLLLTKFHTRQIFSVLVYFTNIQNLSLTPERSDKNVGGQPRLSLLSSISIARVEISIPFLNISPVDGKKAADFVGLDHFLVNEILLEEALTDLLSQVACFELMSPSKELTESLIHLCVNRISSLGLKLESAQSCVNSAIDSFFREFTQLKSSQSEIYCEISGRNLPR